MQVDFIEGHGTGTPKGDPVELRAVSTTMRRHMESKGVPREAYMRRVGMTSAKSLLGHTKAASGEGEEESRGDAVRKVTGALGGGKRGEERGSGQAYASRVTFKMIPHQIGCLGLCVVGMTCLLCFVTWQHHDPTHALHVHLQAWSAS